MIGLIDLRERSREWSLREDIVEKDYVLGWLLWGIASHPVLASSWVFKGGTCLKKCYFETYRFSEDLDFTLIERAPQDPGHLRQIFAEVADRIYGESGIEIPSDLIRFEVYKTRRGTVGIEGRVYYRGPRRPGGDLPRVKLDLTADEVVVHEPVPREIAHPYSDGLPGSPRITCYSLPEIFGEKLRALAERCLPRDVYDVINIFRRPDLRGDPQLILDILRGKCRHKGISVPTFASIQASPRQAELESEWENMLAHQLPELPPWDTFQAELSQVFNWLEAREVEAPLLPAFPAALEVEMGWAPPASLSTWGLGFPLETIRFSGANRLCIDLGYQGSVRRVEPYSLRRSKDGHLLFYAVRTDSREPRGYRVDRIESVQVTRQPFAPVYPVEFWPTEPISVSPVPGRHGFKVGSLRRSSYTLGPRYVVECTQCGKRFTRKDTNVGKHKMKGEPGYDCPGRTGFVVEVR